MPVHCSTFRRLSQARGKGRSKPPVCNSRDVRQQLQMLRKRSRQNGYSTVIPCRPVHGSPVTHPVGCAHPYGLFFRLAGFVFQLFANRFDVHRHEAWTQTHHPFAVLEAAVRNTVAIRQT